MKKVLLTALLVTLTTAAVADETIMETTRSWKSVPITVDQQNSVYTVEGAVPEGDYYYTYPGYRCLREKKDMAGVNILMLHAGVAGGSDIYCYPEQ